MKTFYIPTLGTEVVLAQDWTFTVINDHRNLTLIETFNLAGPKEPDDWSYYPLGGGWNSRSRHHATITAQATLVKGTRLVIDRIYIRKGNKDFDSLTFRVLKTKTQKGFRFFAKLDDVNRMVVES